MESLTSEGREVLLEAMRRSDAFAQGGFPNLRDLHACQEYVEQLAHGPRYSPKLWFGSDAASDRMRVHRGLLSLEQAGLVVLWGRHGAQTTNVKLTAAGDKLAREMAGEAVAP